MFKVMAPFQPATPPSSPVRLGLADSLGDRREELHRAWVDFFETDYRHNGDTAHTREYLLVVGVRR